MKKALIAMLICPSCLPDENKLTETIIQEQQEDIIEGSLTCHQCGKSYPIRNGIAFLEPSLQSEVRPDSRYETSPVLSSYMWSHYGDILKESEATSAYSDWADLMQCNCGVTIDIGSAVGRFTFEMSQKSNFVVGIDNSLSFIQSARELMTKKEKKIVLQEEGFLVREETLCLPEEWDTEKVEFVVGDAQALPFRSKTFSSLASLNLVDKIPFPMKHLKEMNRVAKKGNVQFLFSDPFSWSTNAASDADWLGGTDRGPYSGRGIDNIIALLKGEKSELLPEWKIERHGHIWWKIRTHCNHFELIRSCFVKANR